MAGSERQILPSSKLEVADKMVQKKCQMNGLFLTSKQENKKNFWKLFVTFWNTYVRSGFALKDRRTRDVEND